MAARGFDLIEGGEDSPPPKKQDDAGLNLLTLGLRALSQRAVAAIADLFTLATVASAWWLWMLTPNPNINQIVSLSLYGMLILAANWIVRR